MKTRIFLVIVASLWLAFLSSHAAAGGPLIADHDLNITLALPEGFEAIPGFHSPQDPSIHYAFRREGRNGDPICIFVQQMPGIIGREGFSKDKVRNSPSVVGLYTEKWKSFDVQVSVIRETKDEVAFITRNVQVPIQPRAIQLKIFGTEAHDAEMAVLARTLLASLDGPSNWMTNEQRVQGFAEGSTKFLFWIAGIGLAVYGSVAWRTSAFRKRAIAMGLSDQAACQAIRPHWAWYLLGAYLLFAGICTSSYLAISNLFDFKSQSKPLDVRLPLAVLVLSLVLAATIIGIAMHRRARAKRQILSLAPVPPLPANSQ